MFSHPFLIYTFHLLRFNDKLTIVVRQGVSATVNLSAEAKGTTIVSYPPLMDGIDLGPHFSKGLCQKQFTLMNKGRRVQALSWSTDGFSLSKLKRLELEKSSRDVLDPNTKVVSIYHNVIMVICSGELCSLVYYRFGWCDCYHY